MAEAMRGPCAVANSFTRRRRSCDPSAESEATGLILGTDLRPANIRTAAFGNTLNALEVSVWRSLIARRSLWWRSSHRMVSTFRSSSPEHRVHHHRPWPTVPRPALDMSQPRRSQRRHRFVAAVRAGVGAETQDAIRRTADERVVPQVQRRHPEQAGGARADSRLRSA